MGVETLLGRSKRGRFLKAQSKVITYTDRNLDDGIDKNSLILKML
jgi:hypothetical protein